MKPFKCVQIRIQACLSMLSTKCVYKSYIYSIYIYKEDLALYNLQWLIFHKIQPNQSKSVKDDQLTLMTETRQKYSNNNDNLKTFETLFDLTVFL